MHKGFGLLATLLPVALAVSVYAQAPPSGQNSVSREEYDKLKREQDVLRQEVQEMREQMRRNAPSTAAQPQPAAGKTAPPPADAVTREDVDDLEKQIKSVRDDMNRNRLGLSQFVLAGDADFSFTSKKSEKSTFEAGVAPLILWRPEKNILIEAGFDIAGETDEEGNSDTAFDLTLANISFLINDNLYVGGGLFVVPFGVYHRHFDPPWINKFPDDPLPFGDEGIAPAEETGLFLGGSVPIHDMKLTYDLYVTNGPSLSTGADNAGSLNFDDFTDLNNGKAIGGRIGFLPRYNIELGYSAMFSQTNPPGFSNTNAFLQAVDANWRQDCDPLKGQIDARTEWVWSHVDRATFDATGSEGFGPLSYSNNRYGGYVQLCYRPTKVENKFLRKTELVSRWDILRSPDSAPGGDREQRLTLGVDYWITPAIVLKSAYEIDDKKNGEDQNALLFQIGIGL